MKKFVGYSESFPTTADFRWEELTGPQKIDAEFGDCVLVMMGQPVSVERLFLYESCAPYGGQSAYAMVAGLKRSLEAAGNYIRDHSAATEVGIYKCGCYIASDGYRLCGDHSQAGSVIPKDIAALIRVERVDANYGDAKVAQSMMQKSLTNHMAEIYRTAVEDEGKTA